MHLSETKERIEKNPHLENAKFLQTWNVSSWWNHLPLKFRVDWLKIEHLVSGQMEPRDNESQHWVTAADFQGYTGISEENGKKGSITHKKKVWLEGGKFLFSY